MAYQLMAAKRDGNSLTPTEKCNPQTFKATDTKITLTQWCCLNPNNQC